MIKNTSEIARILSEELGYREGVFDEIVFASQKRKQSVIESIMKALPKKKSDLSETRDNLTSTLTRAALETGGVSLEKLENRLQETLDLYRAHWDFEADTPEGGRKRDINNKWSKGVGTILAAYYEMEETRQAQIDAEDAEKEVERCQKQLKEHQNTKKTLEEQLREFWKNQGRLERKVSLDKKIADDKRDIDVMKTVLKKWPEEKANLANAKELQKQQEFIQIKSRYIGVKAAWDEYRKKRRCNNWS